MFVIGPLFEIMCAVYICMVCAAYAAHITEALKWSSPKLNHFSTIVKQLSYLAEKLLTSNNVHGIANEHI